MCPCQLCLSIRVVNLFPLNISLLRVDDWAICVCELSEILRLYVKIYPWKNAGFGCSEDDIRDYQNWVWMGLLVSDLVLNKKILKRCSTIKRIVLHLGEMCIFACLAFDFYIKNRKRNPSIHFLLLVPWAYLSCHRWGPR